MKGDFTRFTFEPKKHYTSVRMQQGRVQLDSDWNEQADIQTHLTQSVAKDMIGACGAAKNAGGFKIKEVDNTDVLITAGHIYVDGILCELEQETDYTNQPDYPSPDFTQEESESSSKLKLNLTPNKYYLAYLDVWERHITAIEDPNIREVGLNGPDTTTRTKTVWQVKIQEFTPTNPKISCRNLQELSQAERNELTKSWKEEKANTNRGSLTVTVNNDFQQQWENQLYRIEIHQSGAVGETTEERQTSEAEKATEKSKPPTFKWSRDNGSTVFAIENIQGNQIQLKNLGNDASPPFSSGEWIEVIDDVRELQGQPGILVRLTDRTSGNKLFFDPATISGQNEISESTFPTNYQPKIRRWNHVDDTAEVVITSKAEISLEKGIILNFDSQTSYQTGDYWLIPTRKVKVNNTHIDLPFKENNTSFPQSPDGIEHHYCPLALLCYDGNQFQILDLRSTFPSLSNCLDKTGDIMTGALEIQDNLFVTGEDSRVGIGTKTPEAKLEVVGKAKITDSLGIGTVAPPDGLSVRGNFLLATKDGEVSIGTDTTQSQDTLAVKGNTEIDGTLKVTNNNNFVFATTNENKVGIGTDTPQAKLEVIGNGKISDSLGIATDLEENSTDKLAVKGNSNLDGELKVTQNAFLATTNENKVGIGTQNPEAKLEVVGATKISGLTQIFDGDFEVNENALIATADNTQVTIGSNTSNSTTKLAVKGNTDIYGKLEVTNNDNIVLATTEDKVGINTATPKQKLVINSGKVGIGYNEPNQTAALAIKDNVGIGTTQVESNQKLVVKGDTYLNGELEVNESAFLATNGGNVGVGTSQVHQNTFLGVKGSTSIGEAYLNQAAPANGLIVQGNVGIGTDSPDPATKLDVSGKVKIKDGVGIGTEAPTSGLTVKGRVDIVSELTQNTGNPEADEAQLYVRGDVYIDGEVYANTIRSEDSRLNNSSGLGIIDAQFINSLIINPDSAYQAITLYNSVGISGGLAIGELSLLPEGELKVINSAFLATTKNTQVSIGTSQQPQENNLLGVAGNTTIGSSYANTQPAPPNGLLVEGKTHIGDNPPLENIEANEAQLYVQGNAYIDGEIYAKNIRTTGSRLRNSSGLSIIDTQFTDSLIVNPDSEYQAIILYKSVGIGDGGLAVGELSSLPDGELKVTNSAFLATNSGNVGIGTEFPESDTKLDIVGNVRVAGGMGIGTTAPESGVRVNGSIEADTVQTNTIIARNFVQESSREYKDNITNLSIQESKQILDNLKPVKYSYRKDPSQKLHAGFIAEEAHDLFTSTDKTMLNSTGIIAILTSVLKEQMYENSDLNSLILQQQQEIDQLSIRLKKIEKNQRKRPLRFSFMNVIRNIFT